MTATRPEVRFDEDTIEAAEPHMVHEETEDVALAREVPKSPRMPWPKEDKLMIGPVHVSPRNPWLGKLLMKEKGKAISVKSNEEEEGLQVLIDQTGAQDDEEDDVPPMPFATKLPTYVPLWKGKVKAAKDLEAMKSVLQTPLLPEDITFEGPPLGWVPTMKFNDWDLADSEKFPHMTMERLMKQKVEGPVIMLEPQKCLCGVEKDGLLHLRWIPHFHCVPITIFIMRQLLCLVHDGYLWLEEPIPNTAELIRRISWLPCKGRDLVEIAVEAVIWLSQKP